MHARVPIRCAGASLIELLVVLFIMGVMMGLLFPAIQNARARAMATVCENNVHQLSWGLSQAINAKRRFPPPGRWAIEVLPYIEQRPLYQSMEHNKDPNASFPRTPLFRCPMQPDFYSRIPEVGVCHYYVVMNREEIVSDDDTWRGWSIQDRELLDDGAIEEPWYASPEIRFSRRDRLFAEFPGPHPPGLYMTPSGLQPR